MPQMANAPMRKSAREGKLSSVGKARRYVNAPMHTSVADFHLHQEHQEHQEYSVADHPRNSLAAGGLQQSVAAS